MGRKLQIALLLPLSLFAKPHAPTVAAGDVDFISSTQIMTRSDRTIVEWNEFSLAEHEMLRIMQPSVSSSMLNRVTGSLPSSIMGTLSSNGQIILLNTNGIVIGNQGRIDVGSFIASTLDVTNADFLKGDELAFFGDSEKSIEHLGKIIAPEGDILLLAHTVDNKGELEGKRVTLASSPRLVYRPKSTDHLFVEVVSFDESNPYAGAINQDGMIQATSIENRGGEIYLVAEKTVVTGTMHASDVRVAGRCVELSKHASITGDHVRVGGGFQGNDKAMINANRTYVGSDTRIDAPQGKVILWADGVTEFYGTITACGGALCGDGGFVEVSGKNNLIFRGLVDTTAPFGKTGTLLLDPTDITISAGATAGGAFDGGSPTNTFSGTAASATLNRGDLSTALTSNNVVVTTTSGFASAGNVTFSGTGTITSSAGNDLTITADNNITFTGDTTFTDGSPNTATFTFTAGNDISNNGGDDIIVNNASSLVMSATGDITFNNNVNINGTTSVSITAAGATGIDVNDDVVINGSTTVSWTASTGNINIDDTITVSGGTTTFTMTATAGDILYGADVTSDAPTTTFTATAGDIIFDGGGDMFANPTSSATVSFIAGNDINVDFDMDFEDTSGSNNVAFVFTAGNDFINQPPDNIEVNNAGSFTVTADQNVTIQDPITITGSTTSATITATNGSIVINGNLTSSAITTLLSAPSGTGDITFSSSGGTITANPASTATFTFNAGNDISIEDDTTLNDTSGTRNVTFAFTAGNDITNTAGNFVDCNGAAAMTWTTTSGDITVNDPIDSDATTTSFTSGNDMIVLDQIECDNPSGGALNVTTTRDLLVGPSTVISRIGSRVGTVTIDAGRDLTITGGTGTSDFSQIGMDAATVNSDINLTIGRNLAITAGTTTGTCAFIGHGARDPVSGTKTGNIILTSIGGSATLTAGSSTDTWAQIGHIRGNGGAGTFVTATGDIRGSTAGSNAEFNALTMTPGSGTTAYTLIGHGGQSSSSDDTYSGDIRVKADSISLATGTGTDTFSAIGFYGLVTGAGNIITVSSGSEVHVTSDAAVTLQGGAVSSRRVAIGARIVPSSGATAAITMDEVEVVSASGSDISLLGGTAEAVIGAFAETGTASVATTTVTSGRDLILTAETGSRAQIVNGIGSVSGSAMTVTASRDALLTAGTGFAAIDSVDTLTMSTTTGDITLTPSATGVARITAQNASSTTTITSASDITLATGTSESFIEVADDDLIVTATAGAITLNANTRIENNGTGASATITTSSGTDTIVREGGFIRNDGTGTTSVSASNDITVSTTTTSDSFIEGGALSVSATEDITLTGSGTNDAYLECTSGACSVTATNGDIEVNARGRIEHSGTTLASTLTTSSGGETTIQNGGSVVSTGLGLTSITASTNFKLLDSSSITTAATTSITSTSGDIMIDADALGDTTITSGSSLTFTSGNLLCITGDAGFKSTVSNTGGTLTATASSGTLMINNGSTLTNSGGTSGATTITASRVSLDNGAITNSGAGLTTVTSTNTISVVDASSISGSGAVTVTAGNDILILASTTGDSFIRGGGTTLVSSENNISLLGANAADEACIETSSGDLTVRANDDVQVFSFARIENTGGGGTLSIIVDNLAPSPPSIGSGGFSLFSTASLSTTGGGPLRIFTAKRNQNTILGTSNLNGTTFVPGTLFVDTATEQWATYFPSTFGGTPFTIFYKDGAAAPAAPAVINTILGILAKRPNALIGEFELFYRLNRKERILPWDFTFTKEYDPKKTVWRITKSDKANWDITEDKLRSGIRRENVDGHVIDLLIDEHDKEAYFIPHKKFLSL